jgi:hypothetical protein
VRVRAHSRSGKRGVVDVDEYWRDPPGEGSPANPGPWDGPGGDEGGEGRYPRGRPRPEWTEGRMPLADTNGRDGSDSGKGESGGGETGLGQTGDGSGFPTHSDQVEGSPENNVGTPILSPTNEPVDPDALYGALDFDPNGQSEFDFALQHPLAAYKIGGYEGNPNPSKEKTDNTSFYYLNVGGDLRKEAMERATKEYGEEKAHNDVGDAFRHAYWSYRISEEFGSDIAKQIGDAHERNAGQATGEQLMDLFNNAQGRMAQQDPANKDRDPAEVIKDLIRDGRLQTRPMEIVIPQATVAPNHVRGRR